jgi:hypothetical protein
VSRRAAIGLAAGLAAFAATAILAVAGRGGGSTPPRLPLGPERVPIPAAPALARPRIVKLGQRIDGIACERTEQVLFHIHAHLTLFVDGEARQVPAGIGIGPGASCFMWLHTHVADGIVHTESPVTRTYTLGDFFDVWGQPLGSSRVGPARGQVTALVDGRVFAGDPRKIALRAHAQIQLDVGRPRVAPERIAFPPGL